jgi:cytochrome P450
MAQLATEIRSAFTQDSDMTFRAVEQLKYMTAVINESLRIYPPFVTSLSRVVPQGGAVVNGHFVPEGVCICIPLYSVTSV